MTHLPSYRQKPIWQASPDRPPYWLKILWKGGKFYEGRGIRTIYGGTFEREITSIFEISGSEEIFPRD
jgi:hypothetical protein